MYFFEFASAYIEDFWQMCGWVLMWDQRHLVTQGGLQNCHVCANYP